MPFFAYVIRSIQHDYMYKGHCADLEKRLRQHNSKQTASIKKYAPFEIVYFEEFDSREAAVARENYFKTAAGRRFIQSKLTLR